MSGVPKFGNVMEVTKEESLIYSRVSRRGFMGCTAAATLTALAGREPLLALAPRSPGPDGQPSPAPRAPETFISGDGRRR